MNVIEAYKIAKQLPDRNYLIECTDFGEFFGFVFLSEPPSEDGFSGVYDAVNKATGEVFLFNPPDDFEIFDKGIQISIESIDGTD